MNSLHKFGFNNNNLEILPFLSRKDYIYTLEHQDALLLGIDWDDESEVHIDELSTKGTTISVIPIFFEAKNNLFSVLIFSFLRFGSSSKSGETMK